MKKIAAAIYFNLFLSGFVYASCPDGQFRSVFYDNCIITYQDWITEAWTWGLTVMIPLSVLILTAAGVIYMISEGDSKRIELAKRLIIGVISGVG
ncbi:hypothetical protein K0A96_02075, partial [Patescibacteria group bacterium]|nr:hypothetical protein [Patescibacteria group bacterium]